MKKLKVMKIWIAKIVELGNSIHNKDAFTVEVAVSKDALIEKIRAFLSPRCDKSSFVADVLSQIQENLSWENWHCMIHVECRET